MDKSHLISLVLISAMFVSSAQSAPPPKIGGTCAKTGVTKVHKGKAYLCTKKGKKLVWIKGKVSGDFSTGQTMPTASPTQSTTVTSPAPIPIPTVIASPPAEKSAYERFIDRDAIATKNLDLWRKNFATGKPQSKIEYWFGSKVPIDIVEESKRRMDHAVLQWERFHKVSRSSIFFDLALKDQTRNRCEVLSTRSTHFTVDWCLNSTDNQFKTFFYSASAFESEGGWRPILNPKLSPKASVSHSYSLLNEHVFFTDSFFPRIEHEWIHQIQFDLTGNHYIREYPVWFVEGSAEYLGLLTASASDPNYFLIHRAQSWISYDSSLTVEYFRNWLSKNTIPRLSYTDKSDSLPTDGSPYKLGAMATEWLVSKVGFDGLITLLRDTETMGWAKSFEKNVGVTQDSVRNEIADYLYAEYRYVNENRNWLSLPRCKSLFSEGIVEANKGVCFSNDGRMNS